VEDFGSTRARFGLKRFAVLAAAALTVVALSSCTSSPATTTTSTTTVTTERPRPLLLIQAGIGTQQTKQFTTPEEWDLTWNFRCPRFLGTGNFQVYLYSERTFLQVPVNQVGNGTSGVEHFHRAGTFYMTINSVCAWHVQVNS
jgi:hypothetical protein